MKLGRNINPVIPGIKRMAYDKQILQTLSTKLTEGHKNDT
jgi:hypothetical protein